MPTSTMWDPVSPPAVKTLTVCVVSDTHGMQGQMKALPQADAVIHAGDFTARGEYQQVQSFADWGDSMSLPKHRRICIAGNHDISLQTKPEVTEPIVREGWTYLREWDTDLEGLKVWGSPWSPMFFPEHWSFQLQRGSHARDHWAEMPDDADIVVTHGPPFGYGDLTSRGYHVGDVDLLERLRVVKPRLVVCGHIHEGYGVYATDWGGVVVNASTCTLGYAPKNKPIVVRLPQVGHQYK